MPRPKFFSLHINFDTVEAEATPNEHWDSYDGLFKADILKDLKFAFEEMYEKALEEMRAERLK